ncbi:MAG: sugar phosphate isomerase/epimerase [Chloroflexi bacterium]|nr:sugar phosphate isomerase/epimerase [Chloroflexota bacterium]
MAPLPLGIIVSLREDPSESVARVREFNLPTCQVNSWNLELCRSDVAERLRSVAESSGVRISSLWAGIPGRRVWDFDEGPSTIGLVPPQNRQRGVDALRRWSDFAAAVGGIPSITTHVGFLPVDPRDGDYVGTIEALKIVVEHCKGNNQEFWFETGQEAPVILLRAIQDIGLDNVGINLDPANLLLYGMANPVDALDVFGKYVHGIHAKDGLYPTEGHRLGHEMPLGQGRVDFPRLFTRLKDLGFQGAVTIEREISGPQQTEDIRKAIALLQPLVS